jgi:ABC-2 type transport system permease protein
MKHSLQGLSLMNKLAFKLGRLQAIVWAIIFVGYSLSIVPTYSTLFPDPKSRLTAASLFDMPASKMFAGPGFGLSTTDPSMNASSPSLTDGYGHVIDIANGPLVIGKLYLFFLICISIMAVFFVIRLTRAQEESGLAELVRAGRIGNKVSITSSLIFTGLTCLILSLVVGVSFILGGEAIIDSIVVSIGLFLCGVLFASIGILFSELCASARTARLYSMGLLVIFFLFGIIGNSLSPTGSVLTWLSPFQWAFLTRPYAGLNPLPLLLYLPIIILLILIAYKINSLRDVGSGVIQARGGKIHAGKLLRGPFSLNFRLQRSNLIGFSLAIIILGALFGSLTGTIINTLETNDSFKALITMGSTTREQILSGFYSFTISYIIVIVSIFAIISVKSLLNSEHSGILELILSTKQSSLRTIVMNILFTLTVGVFLIIIGGLFISLGAIASNGESGTEVEIGKIILSSLERFPSLLLVIGVAVFLIGFLPKLFSLVWLYFGYGIISFMFLDLFGFPKEVQDVLKVFSPFNNLAQTPSEDFSFTPFLLMTIAGAVLCIVGSYRYSKRDVISK